MFGVRQVGLFSKFKKPCKSTHFLKDCKCKISKAKYHKGHFHNSVDTNRFYVAQSVVNNNQRATEQKLVKGEGAENSKGHIKVASAITRGTNHSSGISYTFLRYPIVFNRIL